MTTPATLMNYVAGTWRLPAASALLDVSNPATGDVLGRVPLSTRDEVAGAVAAARSAFPAWRRTPVTERVQYLFALKTSLEHNVRDLSAIITQECGKTLAEAEAEVRRGIENVEVATGMPSLLMGSNLEDIASGIDELMFRQPLGVVAAITPFNFPAMIPLWFLPYAIAAGNCFVLKPSERVPLTMQRIVELVEATGLSKGVVSLVHGGREAVDAILDHPDIRAVSFVGSSAVAKYVYARGTAAGKRVQSNGGAKNPVVVLPDADMEMTTKILADSAFGCAGQRCLAASTAITVGEAHAAFRDRIAAAAASRRVGYGLEPGVEMGPVISEASKERIQAIVGTSLRDGARACVDGRTIHAEGYPTGHFVGPTVLEGVSPESEMARTEVFGPVLSLTHVDSLEQAIALVNRGAYGNMACLFTSNGAAARKFRYEVDAGNVGINVGVAAPMAFFPFSGWKESFYGDLHAQGRDSVDFYTDKKVVVERWPREWSRRF